MKKILLAGLATVALALGAMAQGTIYLDDSVVNKGVALNTAGNYYQGGAYTLQVWILNTNNPAPSNINGQSAQTAYSNMTGDGFANQGTFTGTMTSGTPGTFKFGNQTLAGVNPAGGNVYLALVAWTGSASSWANAVSGSAQGGLIDFIQATATGTAPVPNMAAGWNALNQDLIMTQLTPVPTPEPATIAFAALGLGGFLVARRRK
jgi:hypothetical protein